MAASPTIAAKRARRVLVTGAGGPSGHAAIVALKQRGFHVEATDIRDIDCPADVFHRIPRVDHPEFLPALHMLLRKREIDWLFPTVAEELVIVAAEAPTWRHQGIAVFVAPKEATAICHDKWLTAESLRGAGVPIPRSSIGDESSAAALGYPLLSKPRVGRGGRGVVIHDAPGMATAGGDTLWQEFLPGQDYDVLIVLHPRAPHARLVHQVFEKTELREGRVGNALRVQAVEAPDVLAVAEAAARAAGAFGPNDIDVRRDSDGRPRVLEINARIGAHTLHAPQVFDALVKLYEQGEMGT